MDNSPLYSLLPIRLLDHYSCCRVYCLRQVRFRDMSATTEVLGWDNLTDWCTFVGCHLYVRTCETFISSDDNIAIRTTAHANKFVGLWRGEGIRASDGDGSLSWWCYVRGAAQKARTSLWLIMVRSEHWNQIIRLNLCYYWLWFWRERTWPYCLWWSHNSHEKRSGRCKKAWITCSSSLSSWVSLAEYLYSR